MDIRYQQSKGEDIVEHFMKTELQKTCQKEFRI